MKYMPVKDYNPIQQRNFLNREYPNGEFRSLNGLAWEWYSTIQPTELSPSYNYKIVFRGNHPKIYILDKLELAKDETKLPHVYNSARQQICLYYYRHEWNPTIKVSVLVPWVSEWLYYYERWVLTGTWYGGGKHPHTRKKGKK